MVSAFYSLRDTKTPVKIAVVCVLVNIGLGAVLMQYMAHVGLALAVSASGVVNVLLLLMAFYRKTGIIPLKFRPFAIFLALSIAVGIGAFFTAYNPWLGLGLLPVWAVAYILACLGLKTREARLFMEILASRAKRKKS